MALPQEATLQPQEVAVVDHGVEIITGFRNFPLLW